MPTQEEIERFKAMDAANKHGCPQSWPATSPVTPCVPERWVAVELRTVNGDPVPGAAYVLTLPDGTQRTGNLDSRGFALEVDIEREGRCRVVFPDVTDVVSG